MLNSFSVLSVVGTLIIFYLWRITHTQKSFLKEVIVFIILLCLLLYTFYYQGILNLIERGLVPTETLPKTGNTIPLVPTKSNTPKHFNSFEKEAQQLSTPPPTQVTATHGAPSITIIYPKNGEIFHSNTKEIVVTARVTDDNDPNPIVEGVGKFQLQAGYNPITVVAIDKDGNINSDYVIVQLLE